MLVRVLLNGVILNDYFYSIYVIRVQNFLSHCQYSIRKVGLSLHFRVDNCMKINLREIIIKIKEKSKGNCKAPLINLLKYFSNNHFL